VSFHNSKYWMYYAVTKGVGSQSSAIGLATSPSGLPGTWSDQGAVISSPPPSTWLQYNAIDPSLLVVAPNSWWLVFGSFWGGIFITPLDPATGMLKDPNTPPTRIASRTFGDTNPNPIEGGDVYQHGNAYYLFASFDYCCNSDPRTDNYSIHVGRSTSPTGPYMDEANVPMVPPNNLTSGGGTTVLASHGYVAAPGGNSVVHDNADNHDLLVYHYLDSRLNYQNFLGINFLCWDGNDFPQAC
jgi:arabinan endo-1,5-alpha-L-arabinosidase